MSFIGRKPIKRTSPFKKEDIQKALQEINKEKEDKSAKNAEEIIEEALTRKKK